MTVNDASTGTERDLSQAVLAVARDHDRQAFRRIYLHFAPRLKTFLMRSGSQADQAEEVIQETMVKVWRRAETFDPGKASVAAWVYTIARNVRIDLIRKVSRPEIDENDPCLVPDSAPPPNEMVEQSLQAERLRQVMTGLPEEQREVLNLAFFEEKSHGEVAEQLGIPLGTVKSRIRLALKRIRSEYGGEE